MRIFARVLGCWLALAAAGGAARAAEPWQDDFERVCSRTQEAMTLSTEELRALVARCDELKRPIAALDESQRKVWTKRLQLCRDLYQFMLQTKEQERP